MMNDFGRSWTALVLAGTVTLFPPLEASAQDLEWGWGYSASAYGWFPGFELAPV